MMAVVFEAPTMKSTLNTRKSVFFLLIILGLLTDLLIKLYLTSILLCVEEYKVEAAVDNRIRIVHLSDLHNSEFGRNNVRLVRKVQEQHPDLILMSGDMLNRDEENIDVVTALIRRLADVAPVFYGYGNHEKAWERRFGYDLKAVLEKNGANVVDNSFYDVSVQGNEIRIGGYMGYYQAALMDTKDPAEQEKAFKFAKDFQNTDRVKLLINHIPTQWVDWDYVDKFPVDLVFSGHYHGGVMRSPFLDQGLYAPYVGWFPPFTKGVYAGEKAICVLSAGLGSEYHIPRLNNPPEIVAVELVPKG